MSELSRRGFITRAAKLCAGAAALTVVSPASPTVEAAVKKKIDPTVLPYPYKKIDPKEAARIAYEDWFDKYCGYASISGIVKPLTKSVGEPYSSFPMDVGIFLFGGGATYGGMCGALVGAGIAVSLVVGDFGCLFPKGKKHKKENSKPATFYGINIMNDLINWYTDNELPLYKPNEPELLDSYTPPRSKSGSPLCHVTLSRWMKASGQTFGSPERYEMCARLTADVVARTVGYLNDWADGKYKEGEKLLPVIMHGMTTQHDCTDCHGAKVPAWSR